MSGAPPAPKKSKRCEQPVLEDISDDELDSPFNLFFVHLAEETRAERKNLEEAFRIAKSSNLSPEWIDSDVMGGLEYSDDSFVIPCFRGTIFQRIQKKKLKIYGPPILIECIQNGKQLPLPGHPVYSSVFDGARISFTRIEPERKRVLQEKLNWMSGLVTQSLCVESTHLVAGRAEQTDKYKAAIKNSIEVMRTEWIDDLWETTQTTMGRFSGLVKEAIDSYKLRVFEGLEMAISSIDGSDRCSLIQLIEENGATVPGSMGRTRCSHLVTDKTNGEKYAKATEWGTIMIVQTRWIRKCIQIGHLIDEVKYHPKFLSIDQISAPRPSSSTSSNRKSGEFDFKSPNMGPRRLSASTFNLSTALISLEQSVSPTVSTVSGGGGSTVGRRSVEGGIDGRRKSDQFSTTISRHSSVQLTRFPTSQSIQNLAECQDPIDDLRKKVDEERHGELFENCLFYICGVDDKTRQEAWRRFLNETGATRAPNIESATNIVVIAPNQQEKTTIRKLLSENEDILIVNVQWVEECIKRAEIVPGEGFEWTENVMEDAS
uniref:BRCT domain-containing protein n=1 Tax=Caenorhabditis tropicalis TaxID=1561998 RepID=A0A1I7TTX7_9PELO